MREFAISVGTIAAGVLLAMAVVMGAWQIAHPSASVSIDLSKYSCGTDGRTVECRRI